MAYYDIEEIEDLKKEVRSLNRELNKTRDELNRARLALAKIYEIVDNEYDWKDGYCIGEISGDDLKEVASIIKEYGV